MIDDEPVCSTSRGFVVMAIDGVGRPALVNTKYFQRTLKDAERQILLAAGEGDISAGFLVVLNLYSHAHNLGYRPAMGLESIQVGMTTVE